MYHAYVMRKQGMAMGCDYTYAMGYLRDREVTTPPLLLPAGVLLWLTTVNSDSYQVMDSLYELEAGRW